MQKRREEKSAEQNASNNSRAVLACATGTLKILFCRLGIKSFMDTLHLKLYLRVVVVIFSV